MCVRRIVLQRRGALFRPAVLHLPVRAERDFGPSEGLRRERRGGVLALRKPTDARADGGVLLRGFVQHERLLSVTGER